MRKTTTKTIPAVPERTIPAQPKRTETVETTICDACRKHPAYPNRSGNSECAVCGRDVCRYCQEEDPTWSAEESCEYAKPWCLRCLQLWDERYEARTCLLNVYCRIAVSSDEEYENKYRKLRAEWKAESLAIGETEEVSR